VRAVVTDGFGGPEVMRVAEVPDPVPAAGEVVIEVVAAGVNRADLRQREGFYPPPAMASPIIGMECSGRILEVGADVADWRVGDEVCALLAGGGYAERVAVPAEQLLPVPAGVSLRDAAALPEVYATVWSTVFMMAGLAEGDSFLVHGGSSGIGTAATQLAAHRGARVFVTAGTEAKLARCRQLGADVAINYRTSDFVNEVMRATDQRGIDVILDPIGGSYTQRGLAALARGGRAICLGTQEDPIATFDIRTLMAKRAAIIGATLRARPLAEKAEIIRGVRAEVWPAIESGAIAPVIDRWLPLDRITEAHRVVASSQHVGKVLIDVAS
jgi:putative PIG3 family NAD(P)H quinone oxidoreductase